MTKEILRCFEAIFKWRWECYVWSKTITTNTSVEVDQHLYGYMSIVNTKVVIDDDDNEVGL